jgi:hypothetical protein
MRRNSSVQAGYPLALILRVLPPSVNANSSPRKHKEPALTSIHGQVLSLQSLMACLLSPASRDRQILLSNEGCRQGENHASTLFNYPWGRPQVAWGSACAFAKFSNSTFALPPLFRSLTSSMKHSGRTQIVILQAISSKPWTTGTPHSTGGDAYAGCGQWSGSSSHG